MFSKSEPFAGRAGDSLGIVPPIRADRKGILMRAIATLLLLLCCAAAQAQSLPSEPVRKVVFEVYVPPSVLPLADKESRYLVSQVYWIGPVTSAKLQEFFEKQPKTTGWIGYQLSGFVNKLKNEALSVGTADDQSYEAAHADMEEFGSAYRVGGWQGKGGTLMKYYTVYYNATELTTIAITVHDLPTYIVPIPVASALEAPAPPAP